MGDLDGDGKLDVVGQVSQHDLDYRVRWRLVVGLGDGQGHFKWLPNNAEYGIAGTESTTQLGLVDLADVNGDGKVDVNTKTVWNGPVTTYYGDGKGGLSPVAP